MHILEKFSSVKRPRRIEGRKRRTPNAASLGPITRLPRSFLTCDVMWICSKHPQGVLLFPFHRWDTRGLETPTRHSRTQNHVCSPHHSIRGIKPKTLVCSKDSARLLNKHANKGKTDNRSCQRQSPVLGLPGSLHLLLAPLDGEGRGWGLVGGAARAPADAWVSSGIYSQEELVGTAGQPSEGRGLFLTQKSL